MNSEQIFGPDTADQQSSYPENSDEKFREVWEAYGQRSFLDHIFYAILQGNPDKVTIHILDIPRLNKFFGTNFNSCIIEINELKQNWAVVKYIVVRLLQTCSSEILPGVLEANPTLTEDGTNSNKLRDKDTQSEDVSSVVQNSRKRELSFLKALQAAIAVIIPLNIAGSSGGVSFDVSKQIESEKQPTTITIGEQVNPIVTEMTKTLEAEIEIWVEELVTGKLAWNDLPKAIMQGIGRKPEQGPPNQDKKNVVIDKKTGNIQIGECNFTVPVEQVQSEKIKVEEFYIEGIWFVYIGFEKNIDELANFQNNLRKILEIFEGTKLFKNFIRAYKEAGIPITITSLDPNAEFNSANSFMGANCIISNSKGETSIARYIALKSTTVKGVFSTTPELSHFLSLFEELSHLLQNAYGLHNLVTTFGYEPADKFKEYFEQSLDILVQYLLSKSVTAYESTNLQQVLRSSVVYNSESQYRIFSGMPVYGIGTILGQYILEEQVKRNVDNAEYIKKYLDLFIKFSENAKQYRDRGMSIWHAFNQFLIDEFKLVDIEWIKQGGVQEDGSWYSAFINRLITNPDISLDSRSQFPLEIVNVNNSNIPGGGGISTVTIKNNDLNNHISFKLRHSERIALEVYKYNPQTKSIVLVTPKELVEMLPGEILIICFKGKKNGPQELSSYLILDDSEEKSNFNKTLAGIIEDTAKFLEEIKDELRLKLGNPGSYDSNINLFLDLVKQNEVNNKVDFFFCFTRIKNPSENFPYIELNGVFVYFIPSSLYVNHDPTVDTFFQGMKVVDGLGNYNVTILIEDILSVSLDEKIKKDRLNEFVGSFFENNYLLVGSILYSFQNETELREFLNIVKFTVIVVDLGKSVTGTAPIVSKGENGEITTLQIFFDSYKITFRKNNINDKSGDIKIGNEIGVVRIWEFSEGINNLLSLKNIIDWCKEGITSYDDVKNAIDHINVVQRNNSRTSISIDYEQDENQNITAIMLVDVVSGIFFRFELNPQLNIYWFRSIGQNNAVG